MGGVTSPSGGREFPRVIRTRRLALRPFTLGDVDAVLAYESDAVYARFLGVPQPYRRRDAERSVASRMLGDWSRSAKWAVDRDGEAIGHVGMTLYAGHGRIDLYYGLAPAHWGKGYMTEAVRAAIDAGFTAHPGVNRIQAEANPENPASLRVMQKAGMTAEGVLRQHVVMHGVATDQVMCSILRREWEAAREG